MGPRDYPGGPTTKPPEKVSKYVQFMYPDELLDATTIAPCVSTTERIKRRIRTREGADIRTAIRSCLMELIARDVALRLPRYSYVYSIVGLLYSYNKCFLRYLRFRLLTLNDRISINYNSILRKEC